MECLHEALQEGPTKRIQVFNVKMNCTVENLTTGCQSEICEEATTKETTRGNRKNPSFECENEIQSSGTV